MNREKNNLEREISVVEMFRYSALLSGLGLEIKGMKKRGRSCYAIIKEEFNLKGSKQKVYDQFKEIVERIKNES